MRHLKQQTHLMQNIKSANMFQTHTSGQSWSILHTSGQSCFKHILLVNPGQSFTLLVNPSHFWSITSGRSFPCHVCNFWSILHTSNQSVTLLPVTSGQSLTLLGSILHRSIRVKMQSESSTVYEILLSQDLYNQSRRIHSIIIWQEQFNGNKNTASFYVTSDTVIN